MRSKLPRAQHRLQYPLVFFRKEDQILNALLDSEIETCEYLEYATSVASELLSYSHLSTFSTVQNLAMRSSPTTVHVKQGDSI